MDQAALPLNFYFRNARLCLKKATFAKKSQLFHDELNHLRQFETLVGTTIPEHPQFEDRKTEKQIVELQMYLSDARRRIQELEGDANRSHVLGNLKSSPSSSKSDKSTPRSKSSAKSPRSADLSNVSLDAQVPKSSKKSSTRALPTMSKKPDSSQQAKQQSWGVWTANPQDVTLSPPLKKHFSSLHKSRKIAGDLKSPPSGSSRDAGFLLPLRSSSPGHSLMFPDQRAEAILGGCALLASHLQSFEDGGDDLSPKREDLEPSFPTTNKISSSWLSKSRERMDYADTSIVEDDVKSSADKGTIGGRRFRFAPDYFEKRLQGTLNHLQRHCPNTDEDICGSSPSKVRLSTEKSHEAGLLEQGSSEESLSCLGNLPSNFSSSHKLSDMNLDFSVRDKFQPTSNEDNNSPEKEHVNVGADDAWARKIVPAVEQKLTHKMLHACSSPGHSSSGSSRKKHKKKGILSVMDHAIRQAVDSDSDESNASFSKDDAVKSTPKSPRVLQQRELGREKHAKRSGEEVLHHHAPVFQGLQVEALEKKITSLQSLVGDLKRSVEGFTSRVEEEVGTWQCRVQGVETQMMSWRDHAEKELMGMKGSIQVEVQKKLEELTKSVNKAEKLLVETDSRKESSKQRFESRLEECAVRIDSLKRQVDSLVTDVKLTLNRDVKERVQDVSKGLRGDLDLLELGMSKDLEGLRKELDVRFDAFFTESEKTRRAEKQHLEALIEERISKRLSPRVDMASGGKDKALAELRNELRAESERLRRAEKQQIEAFVEEKIERRLSQPMEIVSGGKEKVMADMKTELRLLWSEVDLLIKGREEIKDNMEQLNQIAEKAKEAIGKEQDLLKTENGSLKKQLQYFKKESMQTRIDNEDFKKDIELEVEDLRSNIRRLKEEGDDLKETVDSLKKVRDDLTCDNKSLKKLVEGTREESAARIREFEALRRGNEEFEMLEEGQRMGIGTEHSWKGSRSFLSSILEGWKKISHLESLLEKKGTFDEERSKVSAASQKAEEFLSETLGSFHSELTNMKRQSVMIQEKLMSEKEAAAAALADVLRMKDHLGKETETTISFMSDTKSKTMQFHEGIERERESLRGSIMMAEKEREAALAAAAEAAAAAREAGKALGEISEVRKKSVSFSEHITEVFGETHMKYTKELEGHIEGWRKSMLDEVSKARSHVELIEEEKRKSVSHIEGWRRMMMDEVDSAKSIVEGIQDEKRKSVGHIEGWRRMMMEEVDHAKTIVEGIQDEKRKSLDHIEGWRRLMMEEVDNAKTIVGDIHEEKRKSVCFAEATAFREKNYLEEHKKVTQITIQELAKAIREMSESLDFKLHSMSQRQAHTEQQDEHFGREIGNLSERIKEAFSKLDKLSQESSQAAQELQSSKVHGEREAHEKREMLQKDISALESLVKETVAEQVTVAEKVKKIERAQKDFVHSVEGIQASTQELHKSGTMWLQKYDTAARILHDIEKRLSNVENASVDDDNSNQQLNNVSKGHQIASTEKQRLIRLYRELSGFLQKMKTSEENTENVNIDDCFEDEWAKMFNDKIVAIDVRVKHVESDALPNIKTLETKTEELSVGMHSALECAQVAESKCSALGAELVKVFRMLASSRKESPTKMMGGDGPDEDSEQHHPHHRSRCARSHHSGAKSKTISSHAACTYCKRAAMKGSNDLVDCTKEHQHNEQIQSDTLDNDVLEGHKAGQYYDGSNFDNMSPSMDRSYKESGFQGRSIGDGQDINHVKAYHGGEDLLIDKVNKKNMGQNDKLHRKGELVEKFDDFEALEHLLAKKNLPELKPFEGKLPITHERPEDKRIECAKKDVTHTGSGKNCQSTNIRLDAGKIQVNVSHRSAILSGSRLTKRGDAISVRP
ncbi:hypothetical protein L7F22_031966 [Adiantum nelumboides]|nr:hypothetical protein [Adiantum nelumboides]